MLRKVKRKRKRKKLRRFLSLNLGEEGVEEDRERSLPPHCMIHIHNNLLGKHPT
jgi:hypothetical protein